MAAATIVLPTTRDRGDPMADPPPYPDTGDDAGEERDRGSTTGTSRWQKVVGIIGLVVVLLVGIRMFGAVGGGQGPGGQTLDENQEQELDTDDGGPHDPSRFDHG
jgi:hypothetical protein